MQITYSKSTKNNKMNKNKYQKLALGTASLAFSFVVFDVNPIQAATITYDFEVSIDSGSLLNETYSGYFSFDDSALSRLDYEYLSVLDLEFDFLGTKYTEEDDPYAEVEFYDGDFLGLSFSTDLFSFIPGFFDLSEAFFAYDLPEGDGAGDVTYSLRPSPPAQSTPEPTSMIGLLGLGTLAAGYKLKRKQLQKS